MPGPGPKNSERRQRANRAPSLHVVVGGGPKVVAPPPQKHWLQQTREAWAAYWSSDLAQVIDPATDGPAVLRLFTLHDERERAYRGYRKKRVVTGSRRQQVTNPLARVMIALDAEVRQLEDRLGLTPRARLQLGVTYGEAARSLEAMNHALEADYGADADEEDPRLGLR